MCRQCQFESCYLYWCPSRILGPLLVVDVFSSVFIPALSSVRTTNILLLLLGPSLMAPVHVLHFVDFVGDDACEECYKSCRHCSMSYWTIRMIAWVSIRVTYYHRWPWCTTTPPHFLCQLDETFYNKPPFSLDNPQEPDLSSYCHLRLTHIVRFLHWWPGTNESSIKFSQ